MDRIHRGRALKCMRMVAWTGVTLSSSVWSPTVRHKSTAPRSGFQSSLRGVLSTKKRAAYASSRSRTSAGNWNLSSCAPRQIQPSENGGQSRRCVNGKKMSMLEPSVLIVSNLIWDACPSRMPHASINNLAKDICGCCFEPLLMFTSKTTCSPTACTLTQLMHPCQTRKRKCPRDKEAGFGSSRQ